MAASSGPTYREILAEIVETLNGPIPVNELIDRLLERKPSTAKNPYSSLRYHVLREARGRMLVFLDSETVLPTRLAMKGARFRIPLQRSVITRGELPMDWFSSYLPLHFPLDQVRFLDSQGRPLSFPFRTVRKTEKFFGGYVTIALVVKLGSWLKSHKATRRDALLVTVRDWAKGILQIEVESHRKSNPRLLQERDRLLADLFYQVLEESSYEEVLVSEALPTVYARLPDKEGYPPHHWQIVLEKDERFRVTDISIKYADAPLTPLETLIFGQTKQDLPSNLQPVTPEMARQVYRFKVALAMQKSIWRRVEILGGQTLYDLQLLLVESFDYEPDHLGGFWKRVPRRGKKRTRYRDVELGTVDYLGSGSGATIQIAAIGLKEGDQLKYVYDFGDWYEHILTLEAITPAEEGVTYPREIARNKPRYQYCTDCEKEGRKTVAQWVCATCSDQERVVFCCDECAADFHDDHDLIRIIY